MAEDFKFLNAPDGASPEPNAYHVVYEDRNGKGGSEKVIPSADPALNPNLTDAQAEEKIKALFLQTRADLYLRGVTAEKVHVTKIGPMTPSDRDRFSGAFVEADRAKVTRVNPK